MKFLNKIRLRLTVWKYLIMAYLKGGKKEYRQTKEKLEKLAEETFKILTGVSQGTESHHAKKIAEILKKYMQ